MGCASGRAGTVGVMLARRTVPGIARSAAVLFVAAMALLSACSRSAAPSIGSAPRTGSGTATVVGGVQEVVLTSGNDLRFHPSTITVHQGKVRLVLRNTAPSGAPHNLEFTGLPLPSVPLVYAGKSRMVTFQAPSPGRYRFECTIHLAQGQIGVLVVEPGAASS